MPQAVGRPKTRKPAVKNAPGRPRVVKSPVEREKPMEEMKARFAGERPARCVVSFDDGRNVEYKIKSYSLINSVLTLVTCTGERLVNWSKVSDFEVVDL